MRGRRCSKDKKALKTTLHEIRKRYAAPYRYSLREIPAPKQGAPVRFPE